MKYQMLVDDLVTGVKFSASDCPVARCLKRTHTDISVDTDNITIGGIPYHTPDNVAEFILDFDGDRQLVPIKFELEEELPA